MDVRDEGCHDKGSHLLNLHQVMAAGSPKSAMSRASSLSTGCEHGAVQFPVPRMSKYDESFTCLPNTACSNNLFALLWRHVHEHRLQKYVCLSFKIPQMKQPDTEKVELTVGKCSEPFRAKSIKNCLDLNARGTRKRTCAFSAG